MEFTHFLLRSDGCFSSGKLTCYTRVMDQFSMLRCRLYNPQSACSWNMEVWVFFLFFYSTNWPKVSWDSLLESHTYKAVCVFWLYWQIHLKRSLRNTDIIRSLLRFKVQQHQVSIGLPPFLFLPPQNLSDTLTFFTLVDKMYADTNKAEEDMSLPLS